MICIALTGLARKVIKDLIANRVRTVEIRSPHNFYTLKGVKAGDMVFLTESPLGDVMSGTQGLIARINELQLMTHRIVQSGDYFYEEVESQAARAQLQLVGMGRVREIKSLSETPPLILEVDEVRYCYAR